MKRRDLLKNGHVLLIAGQGRHAVKLAHSISDQDQGLFKSAEIEGAGCVSQMVGDRFESTRPIHRGEMIVEVLDLMGRVIDLGIPCLGKFLEFKRELYRLIVKPMGHV